MQELMNFNFEGKDVRTISINNVPYFVGKDVAEVLMYKEPNKAIVRHIDEDDRMKHPITDNLGRKQAMYLINESGLYSLILSSKLPQAREFKRWVTKEVLPTIRKHGAYLTPEKVEEVLTDPDTIISLATQLKKERTARLMAEQQVAIAEQQVAELKPKASYYDKVLANPALMTITQIAKDYGMSGKAMNALLHDLHVIYKQGNVWLLYSKYQKTGWTQSETHIVRKSDGTEKVVLNTKWTQKGRLGLYDLLKEHGILPLIERDKDDE